MNERRERRGYRDGQSNFGYIGEGNQSGNMTGGPLRGVQFPRGGGHNNNRGQLGGQWGHPRGSMQRQRYGSLQNLGPQPPPMRNPTMWQSGMPEMPHRYMPPPTQSTGLENYLGQPPSYPPGVPPPMYNMPLLQNLSQPLMQIPAGSPVAGSAKVETKDPVTALNEYEPLVTYMECATNTDTVCMVAEIQGQQFEGYAMTKKEAKKRAAEKALKDLFNTVCVEDDKNAAEMMFVDNSSDNDSENNFNSLSSRARGTNRRNRGKSNRGGRMRGTFRQSGSMQNLSTRNDSDNESVCSETSQSGRGRGGRYRGRGRGGRGRGGRGAMSGKSYHRSQEELGGNVESKPQQDNAEFADNADDSFSEAKVFRHLVTTSGGCVTLSKFKETFPDLPEDFEEWIMMPRKRLSVFKSGDKPLLVGPFFKDANLCIDHMGFGGKKNCHRKDCKQFHICNFYLNGWCKRGFNCRKGHTFTKGHNRELKKKLGLNPFKDAEIKTIILCRYPQVCPNSKCTKEDCPYLHVCFNFLRDKCEDSDCARGHDLKTPHNLWVLSVYRMQKWVEDRLALLKFLINRPRTKKNPGNNADSQEDETESIGTVEDEDSEDNVGIQDDDDVEEEEEEDDEEEETELEEITQDVHVYEYTYIETCQKQETEELSPRKRLGRRERWATDVE